MGLRLWLPLCLLLVVCCIAGCGGGDSTASGDLPAQQLQQLVTDTLAEYGVTGVVVGVQTPQGRWIGSAGMADAATRKTMRPDCTFRVGSLSKQFHAALVMLLVDDGTLSLDDSVEQWLPGLAPNGENITIHMLLNHTGGLQDFYENPSFLAQQVLNPQRAWTPAEIVAFSTTNPPYFAPGTQWRYNSTDYVLLGMIVEAVLAPKTLPQIMQERLFTPLGLTHTYFPTDGVMPGRCAHGHWPEGGEVYDVTGWNPSYAWGTGGLVTNAEDLLNWTYALFGGQVVSPASLARMTTPAAPSVNYGFGLDIDSNSRYGRLFKHGGEFPGYLCRFRYYPDRGVSSVILINQHNLADRSNMPEMELAGDLQDKISELLLEDDQGRMSKSPAAGLP